MLVSVCIATYQRPEGLKRLLDGLNELTFNKCETPTIEVIVVDNDVHGSAASVWETARTGFKWVLKYNIEPQRGISYVRNKAVFCVNENASFIAFIDDDEVPAPSWLDELLYVQKTYNADVVSGPIVSRFLEKDVPNWVIKGKFFEWRRYPTGHPLQVAFTNNVIVRLEIFQKIGAFDDRFALTGGEDSHFFMRVYRRGYKMVWADEAIVYEWVPKSRTNIKWILLRGYRTWSTHSLCEREFEPSIKVQAIRMVKGSGLVLFGLFLLLPSLSLKRHIFVKALLHIFRGFGTFSGLVGKHYEEYRQISQV